MKRVTGIGGVFFKAKDAPALQAWYKRHLGIDIQTWVARPSVGPTVKVSRWLAQSPGRSLRRSVTNSRPAPQLSWSTTGWRISAPSLKLYAKKAAVFSRRSTILNTGGLPGSSTQKETSCNSGNRLPANDQAVRSPNPQDTAPLSAFMQGHGRRPAGRSSVVYNGVGR
jgi:hypothetical protein